MNPNQNSTQPTKQKMGHPLHHPPHIYLDDTWYIITTPIYQKHSLLRPQGHKELVRDELKTLVIEFRLRLAVWVVLDNHYHILVKTRLGKDSPRFLGRLHGKVSFDVNTRDGTRGRRVWNNYWDTCIRTETDYWTRFNYIHHNPVKHGYTTKMEDWQFSSCRYYLEHRSRDWLMDAFRQYPIVDFTDPDDDF